MISKELIFGIVLAVVAGILCYASKISGDQFMQIASLLVGAVLGYKAGQLSARRRRR